MDQGYRAVKFGHRTGRSLAHWPPESVLTYPLPEVLKLFRKRYPKVEAVFRPDSDNKLAGRTRERPNWTWPSPCLTQSTGEHLRSIRMRSEDIYLSVRPIIRWPMQQKVYPKDLMDQTLLGLSLAADTVKKLDMQLAAANVKAAATSRSSPVWKRSNSASLRGWASGFLPEIVIGLRTKKEAVYGMNWHGAKMSMRNPHRLAQRQMDFAWHAGVFGCSERQVAADAVADAGANSRYVGMRSVRRAGVRTPLVSGSREIIRRPWQKSGIRPAAKNAGV